MRTIDCRPIGIVALLALLVMTLGPTIPIQRSASAAPISGAMLPQEAAPSVVFVEQLGEDVFQYVVNGQPQVFIGMGYNPIYRHLSNEERAARYDTDFTLLCQAGVNHIIGWDHDKGFEQDKFDAVTLDQAFNHGIGVIMPFYLPPEGNYEDETYLRDLRLSAAHKVEMYKNHPALRMWGVGNEVLVEMPRAMWDPFLRFYIELVDMIHELDPNHPIAYREAEDTLFTVEDGQLMGAFAERPWLLYGMNVYTMRIESLIAEWPLNHDRPLFVSEFGSEPFGGGGRSLGYLTMWETIRQRPDYVLGGAPYTWTTKGPEPTDIKWGLMDGQSQPVDETFALLAERWQAESTNTQCR